MIVSADTYSPSCLEIKFCKIKLLKNFMTFPSVLLGLLDNLWTIHCYSEATHLNTSSCEVGPRTMRVYSLEIYIWIYWSSNLLIVFTFHTVYLHRQSATVFGVQLN